MDFDTTEKLLKMTVHKSFIPRPRMMYCQVRSCARWRREKQKQFQSLCGKTFH